MQYVHFICVYCLRFFMVFYFLLELLIFAWKGRRKLLKLIFRIQEVWIRN